MKTMRMSSLIVVVGLLTLAVAQAQTGTALKVKVPFSFHAGEVQLPAGTYTFEAKNQVATAVYTAKGDGRMINAPVVPIYSEGKGGQSQPKLVFHKYGTEAFLAEIWTSHSVQKVAAGNAERALMRSNSEPVTLVLNSERR